MNPILSLSLDSTKAQYRIYDKNFITINIITTNTTIAIFFNGTYLLVLVGPSFATKLINITRRNRMNNQNI